MAGGTEFADSLGMRQWAACTKGMDEWSPRAPIFYPRDALCGTNSAHNGPPASLGPTRDIPRLPLESRHQPGIAGIASAAVLRCSPEVGSPTHTAAVMAATRGCSREACPALPATLPFCRLPSSSPSCLPFARGSPSPAAPTSRLPICPLASSPPPPPTPRVSQSPSVTMPSISRPLQRTMASLPCPPSSHTRLSSPSPR